MQTMGEDHGVEVFADDQSYKALDGFYAGKLQKANNEHFGTEFLSMKRSIKTIASLDEALDHIHL
jgi:glutamate-5-semialdehyde dehydrogenase